MDCANPAPFLHLLPCDPGKHFHSAAGGPKWTKDNAAPQLAGHSDTVLSTDRYLWPFSSFFCLAAFSFQAANHFFFFRPRVPILRVCYALCRRCLHPPPPACQPTTTTAPSLVSWLCNF